MGYSEVAIRRWAYNTMAKIKWPEKNCGQNIMQKTKDLKDWPSHISHNSHIQSLFILSQTKHESVRLLLISQTADDNVQSGLCESTNYNLNMITMSDEQ